MNHLLLKELETAYNSHFGSNFSIVFSPGRINLIGEHVDYNNGFVFPAAIDLGIYSIIGESNSEFCTVIAQDLNEEFQFHLSEIEPLINGGWINYILGVVYGIQRAGRELKPFNLIFSGDVPNGSGLSSSAALENSIVFALNELFDLGFSKEEMILISQKAEHKYVGVKCGIMDQYGSMFGIQNHFLLLDCKTTTSKAVQIDLVEYEFLLINTNVKHDLSESAYNDRRQVTHDISKRLGLESLREATLESLATIKNDVSEEDFNKALFVVEEIDRTQEAMKVIKQNDIVGLGQLLYDCHDGLQNKYKVSCEELDFLVEFAKNHKNVIGSRMMGGGFGGCTINIVQKEALEGYVCQVSKAYKDVFGRECSPVKVKISNGTISIKE